MLYLLTFVNWYIDEPEKSIFGYGIGNAGILLFSNVIPVGNFCRRYRLQGAAPSRITKINEVL